MGRFARSSPFFNVNKFISMVQNYAMPGIPIGKIEIDSLKVRIPLSKVHILNEELGATLVPVNQQTGDVYNDQTYKKNSYKISYKGISIYFGLENQIDGKRDVVEYLVILFSSKLLSERYFEGITETNIGLLYDRLISFGVVSFDYDIFISSECTDVDFKRDDIQNEFRDAVTFLETSAKSYKQKDKGCNPFKSKDKLGIEFGSRNKANERYPFLKMYAKAVELINNSLDFWSEFLSDQGLDIADLVRTEITIKNKKMKKSIKGIVSLFVITMLIASSNNIFAQVATTGKNVVDIKTSAQCGSCKSAIEKAVNNVDGVKSSNLDLETKIVTVKYDVEKTNVDALKSAIVNIGYDADDVAADAKAYENLHSSCKKE